MSATRKILVLLAVAMIAAACGVWLLTAPSREREYVEAAQEALIEDLMQDIYEAGYTPTETEYVAELPEPEMEETDSVYYYADDCDDFEYEVITYEPEPIYICEPDPLPDNAFSNAIVGIGILTIESIDLRLPIAEGVEYATLRIAPGRVPQTAQVGNIGNAVIAGHRNYTFGSMFNRLGEIEVGDIVQYQARNGEMMEFEVFEIAVIEPHDQIAFIQPVNEAIITLYTCTPTRVASHRLIIRAQRVS